MPLLFIMLLYINVQLLMNLSILTLAAISDHSMRGNETDLEALLAIKSKITDDPHGALRSWNQSLDFCEWKGVKCDPRLKRVTNLDFVDNVLVGTLSPFVGNLSFLRELEVANNTFRGRVPAQLGHLRRLRILDMTWNAFDGEIPANLSRCSRLSELYLGHNKLVGKIPTELGLLTTLQELAVDNNNLTGDISMLSNLTSLRKLFLSGQFEQGIGFQGKLPGFIGTFKNLTVLELGANSFSGTIPASYYNLSSLQIFSLSFHNLEGRLPPDIGFKFPRLEQLELSANQFTGQVPSSLSNLSHLVALEIGMNDFSGKFLLDARNLRNLSTLNIGDNANLGTRGADDLKFLDTLVNCSNLEIIGIGNSNFGGVLPHSIANLSASVRILYFAINHISGTIPSGIGNLLNLQGIDFHSNQLTGTIPVDIGNLPKLELAYFSYNQLSGIIPESVRNLSLLSVLDLSYNNLQGTLPIALGNCKNLLTLDLGYNNLVGNVPHRLFSGLALVDIHLGNNQLEGSIPSEIGNSKNLVLLAMSNNRLSGELPSSLSQCVSLTHLALDGNALFGSIPPSYSLLKDLEVVDLSSNNLSGRIPSFMSIFPSLVLLNLSFNSFEGEVPTKGVFTNASGISLVGNDRICGGIAELNLTRCRNIKRKGRLSRTLIIVICICCVLAGLTIVKSSLYLFSSRRKQRLTSSSSLRKQQFIEVSYDMLLKATNGFSPENLIGAGSFGSVFRGTLVIDGKEEVVAVKVMNNQRRASNSFTAECEALKAIRHRNLVGIITACSSIDFQENEFRALVYEYMPNGSLERWLHSTSEDNENPSLSLEERLNIAIDVAFAVDYIHNSCNTPTIHCDLKPDNILLDENMTARVSDFGLAKILPEFAEQLQNSSSVGVRGTVGYAAPEYGLGSPVSAAGDVYSYGVILLEMMTAVRPTDARFGGELNLHNLAKSALSDNLIEIIDSRLQLNDNTPSIHTRSSHYSSVTDDEWASGCITTIVQIGVQCSSELPQDRMDMKDVISRLQHERERIHRHERR